MFVTREKDRVVISKYPQNSDAASIEWYNNKYGIDGWVFAEKLCSYHDEMCGYGPRLDHTTCDFCNGLCMRTMHK